MISIWSSAKNLDMARRAATTDNSMFASSLNAGKTTEMLDARFARAAPPGTGSPTVGTDASLSRYSVWLMLLPLYPFTPDANPTPDADDELIAPSARLIQL